MGVAATDPSATRTSVQPSTPGTSRQASAMTTLLMACARRVPTFVIEQTGLKTKKQIVAKFGADAPFEKGKALPKAK